MFTRNIKQSVLLGKSGVRWGIDTQRTAPSGEGVPLIAQDITKINLSQLPTDAKEALITLKIQKLSSEEKTSLGDWIDSKIATSNEGAKEKNYFINLEKIYSRAVSPIQPLPSAALAAAVGIDSSIVHSTDGERVAQAQNSQNIRASERRIEAKNTVQDVATTDVKKLTTDMKNLADLNNDNSVDASLRDVVTERELLNALSRVTEGGKEDQLKKVYKNVTGKDISTFDSSSVLEFQTKLRTSLRMIQKLTGGNAGLYGLLKGDLSAYATEIAKIPTDKRTIDLDQSKIDNLTPSGRNLLAGLASAGVVILTGGMVVTDYKKNEINSEAILARLNRSMPTKVFDYLRDVFTGRRFSLTLGDSLKMDVTEFTDKVTDFAKAVVENDAQNPEAQKYLAETQKIANGLNLGNNKEAIQKTAIHAYILDLANGNTGTDWTARISPLFVGANYDAIDKVLLATAYSTFNVAEASLNKRTLTPTEMTAAGIKIEKNSDGTFKHTIPENVKFANDAVGLRVVLSQETNLQNMNGVYDMDFSDVSGVYVVTLKKRNPQPNVSAGTTVAPAGTATIKQEIGKVTNAREQRTTLTKGAKANEKKEFKAQKEFAQELYDEVGHQKRPEFKQLLDAINARDPDARDKAIAAIAKFDKPLAQKLRADKEDYLTWTTYMYGSRATRALDNPEQRNVDTMRTRAVLNAENRLFKSAGINIPANNEANFRLENKADKHEAKQASTIFTDQEMTVAVSATPLGGHHRIDQFDGSIAMSQKTKTLEGDYKNQVIDMFAKGSGKGGITKQVEKLNTFLTQQGKIATSSDNKVTTEDFVKYLKSGNVTDLGDFPGLKLQAGKDTKVFEGRAMVAGNVCMNGMYGIVYPAFEIEIPGKPPVQEKIEPAGNIDVSAKIAVEAVGGTIGAVGLNPIAVAAHRSQDANDGGQTSTPGNDGGTKDVVPGSGGGTPAGGGAGRGPGTGIDTGKEITSISSGSNRVNIGNGSVQGAATAVSTLTHNK